MRYIEFRAPNYKCKLEDQGGNVFDNMYYAESEEELRLMLENLGYNILSLNDYDFQKWRKKAELATQQVTESIKAKKAPKFKDGIWAELKQFLFFLSHEKCGYCESLDVRVTDTGQVEHYRPKRKVDEDEKHPGYYWLAYDVDNYIPCCGQCNTYRGKRTQFPIGATTHARTPEELDSEPRLLLHPFKDKPEEHIFFVETPGPELGKLKGIDPMGETSIRVYNLNRNELVNARKRYFEYLKERLDSAETMPFIKEKILDEFRHGVIQYSIMAKPVIRRWLEERKTHALEKAKKALDERKMYENDLRMFI